MVTISTTVHISVAGGSTDSLEAVIPRWLAEAIHTSATRLDPQIPAAADRDNLPFEAATDKATEAPNKMTKRSPVPLHVWNAQIRSTTGHPRRWLFE
jgi:hypothetical protein